MNLIETEQDLRFAVPLTRFAKRCNPLLSDLEHDKTVKLAHERQPRPDCGDGVQGKIPKIFQGVPSLLGSRDILPCAASQKFEAVPRRARI